MDSNRDERHQQAQGARRTPAGVVLYELYGDAPKTDQGNALPLPVLQPPDKDPLGAVLFIVLYFVLWRFSCLSSCGFLLFFVCACLCVCVFVRVCVCFGINAEFEW